MLSPLANLSGILARKDYGLTTQNSFLGTNLSIGLVWIYDTKKSKSIMKIKKKNHNQREMALVHIT